VQKSKFFVKNLNVKEWFEKLTKIHFREAFGKSGSEFSALLGQKVTTKKKRKSRTAFTAHQLNELEKRFSYQKYLTPSDRDVIADTLGLTSTQVKFYKKIYKNYQKIYKRLIKKLIENVIKFFFNIKKIIKVKTNIMG